MNGGSRPGLFAAALVSLALACGAGMLLADCAAGLRARMLGSRTVETLAGSGRRAAGLRRYASVENAELMLNYIDSMAGAVTNMELSPKYRLGQFAALVRAAEDSGVRLTGFERGEGLILSVSCEGDESGAAAFICAVAAEDGFEQAEIDRSTETGRGTYTILCRFTQ